MKKRVISLVMTLCLCLAILPNPVLATTNGHSQQDALSWVNGLVANKWGTEDNTINYDGSSWVQGDYGEPQCVDLIKAYFDYLVGYSLKDDAKAYVSRSDLPAGWSYQRTPQVGDIAVWSSGQYGHVAIVTSVSGNQFYYVDVNGGGYHFNGAGLRVNEGATNRGPKNISNPTTYIHPDFMTSRAKVAVPEGTYYLYSALGNDLVAGVAGGSTESGANVELQTYAGIASQQFVIIAYNGNYKIQNVNSNLPMDVHNGSREAGANVKQYPDWMDNNEAQQWYFEDAGNGYYYIHSALGTYLDVSGGVSANGQNIQTYTGNESAAQKWKLVKASAAAPSVNVSFGPWYGNNKVSPYIGETDAIIGQTINISSGDPSDSGIYLYDANGNHVATGSNGHLSTWWGYVYFKINEECNYVLTPGTTYKYKFYVVLNGATYWSNEESFKTAGTAPVNYAISLNQSSLALQVNETKTLSASVSPAGTAVAWSSSNPGVATVSSGKVTAVKAGSATITATAGGKTASCAVTVTDKDVAIQSIVLNNTSIALAVGESGTLTASVNPSNATNATLSWSSSNPSVATVSGGKVTAVKAGTATITATAGSKTASCTVTVTDKNVAVQSVTLNNTSIALAVGESGTLTASVNPSNATDKTVTWNSSNTSVVTVSGGKVTAIKAGSATITATAGGKTARCTVTVKDKAVAVESVTMSRADLSLKIGDQATLSATILPSNATSNTIAWSSNNANVATVSNGQVIATGSGTATITATAGEKSATCRVVVAEKEKSESPSDVHFEKATIYFQDQFSDVPANQWYTDSVASAFELGLMNGKGNKSFDPFGDVTIAEAITMAARIHSIYTTGSESFNQSEGSAWYQTYLDYAFKNSIISRAYYNCDATQKANRSQFAEIFAASLPAEALAAMNEVNDGAIPDVDMSSDYANAVYRLYRAGILTGNDANGTFAPQTYITRAESAAIVSRMAESSNRKSITLR